MINLLPLYALSAAPAVLGVLSQMIRKAETMKYSEMDKQALEAEKQKCVERLGKYSKDDISLDLSRGKPSKEQLELSMKMLDVLDHHSLLDSESGQDCRNYGGLDGIPEAKRLLAHMMGTHSVNTIIGGNSSRNHTGNV